MGRDVLRRDLLMGSNNIRDFFSFSSSHPDLPPAPFSHKVNVPCRLSMMSFSNADKGAGKGGGSEKQPCCRLKVMTSNIPTNEVQRCLLLEVSRMKKW